ncbi:ABC transporter substrate-binding protein [Robbsia andropogonis]|uniref:ABC transporter substrate-binding protein n=1 Tax=Robbsia andropogonis TaxID=28092 RepID=UPI000561E85F|nr:ABC transporter substrate-binding protein [Robbsia andropogonis]MCP1118541.1 ABC transporter substrate-binding protein [Robbsia andropogonis]MCP1128008.1 ABC transporter substrate-binding protein [Robbsia andropogonis]
MRRAALSLAWGIAAMGWGAAAHAETKLTMYYPISVGGPLTKIMDGLIARFQQQHPDIAVQAIYAGDYDQTRVRAVSASHSRDGSSGQLAVLGALDTWDLIDHDLIVPFDQAAGDDGAWLKTFYPALLANSNVANHVWGVPFQRSTIVMYYNKAMFKAAGLDPDKPPKTWDEMLVDAKKLTNADHYGLMIPSGGFPYWMFQALAIENGVTLMSEDGTHVKFNSPAAVQALAYWVSLAKDAKVSPQGIIDWSTLRQAFVQGKTAMMWHTTGNLTAVKHDATFDFGVAMLPANKRAGSPTGGGNFYLFKGANADQQKAALTFIRWMTAPEQAARWSIATGYVGTAEPAYQTQALREYGATFPQAMVARDQLKVAVPELSTHDSARVREALNNALQSAITGTTTPQQALDKAQATADRILARYR